MERIIIAALASALVTFAFVGLIDARSGEDVTVSNEAANLTRACSIATGDAAITLAATTGTDADSGELNAKTIYMIRCDTDAWIRTGDAAVTAVADDWRVNAGEVQFHWTGGSQKARHISALSVTDNGDCRLIECM